MEPSVLAIRILGEAATEERIVAIVNERYAPELYRPATAEEADVIVTIAVGAEAVDVVDAPRHRLLYARLSQHFGPERVEPRPASPVGGAPVNSLCYQIDAAAQNELFREFGRALPGGIQRLFPIAAPGSRFEIQLLDTQVRPPATPLVTRWNVVTQLSLFDTDKLEMIERGRFTLSNFYGPRENGRIGEPAQRLGRPFDEAIGSFFEELEHWLDEQPRQRLKAAGASVQRPLLRELLDLQLSDGP